MRFLRRIALVCCLAICLPLAAFAQFDEAQAHRLFDQANEARSGAGLPPFAWNEELAQAARRHAEKMAAAHSLSHRIADEADLSERVAATGLRFSAVAENIAYSSERTDDFHSDWMHSSGHRANILSRLTDSLGVAVLDYKGHFYAVEDFAKATSSDPSDKAESRFSAEFNRLRVEHHQARAKIDSRPALRDTACAMAARDEADAATIPHQAGDRGTIAFTANEPEQLPAPILRLIGDPTLAALSVGSCFKTTTKSPGGAYWFAVVY